MIAAFNFLAFTSFGPTEIILYIPQFFWIFLTAVIRKAVIRSYHCLTLYYLQRDWIMTAAMCSLCWNILRLISISI